MSFKSSEETLLLIPYMNTCPRLNFTVIQAAQTMTNINICSNVISTHHITSGTKGHKASASNMHQIKEKGNPSLAGFVTVNNEYKYELNSREQPSNIISPRLSILCGTYGLLEYDR